jgi:hypothetical protein
MSNSQQFKGAKVLVRTTYAAGASGNHTLNAATKWVRAILQGAGGGGGKSDASGSATLGSGYGGGGGAYLEIWLPASVFAGPVPYSVGSKGIGRTGTPGAGSDGGSVRFGGRRAMGGKGGGNGRVTVATASTALAVFNGAFASAQGDFWGAIDSSGNVLGSSLSGADGVCGGDGGISLSAGGAGQPGLAAGVKYRWMSGVGLQLPTATLAAGGTSSAYDGGGGGGSSMLGTGGAGGNGHSTAPTAGANATGYGGGGGGGGGAGSGVNNAGDGGNGSDGVLYIEEYA